MEQAQNKELREMCLNCRRPTCFGTCDAYERAEKQVFANGPRDSIGRLMGNRIGYGKTIIFAGREMTIPEFAKKCNANRCSVYKHLERGKSPRDVYEFYMNKNVGGKA